MKDQESGGEIRPALRRHGSPETGDAALQPPALRQGNEESRADGQPAPALHTKKWYAGLAAAAVVAGAAYALTLLLPRVITVRVYSDYSFRLQHSNWSDLLESRFRDAALIFRQSGTGVQWKVLDSKDTDPTSDMATLDSRRVGLPEQGDNQAEVLVSFTGVHEADRIGSSNPFSRATIVVDFPDRSESANTIILAHNLPPMFAASPDPAWVQSASSAAPQNAHFPPRVVTLIHQLRRYNLAAGVDGLRSA